MNAPTDTIDTSASTYASSSAPVFVWAPATQHTLSQQVANMNGTAASTDVSKTGRAILPPRKRATVRAHVPSVTGVTPSSSSSTPPRCLSNSVPSPKQSSVSGGATLGFYSVVPEPIHPSQGLSWSRLSNEGRNPERVKEGVEYCITRQAGRKPDVANLEHLYMDTRCNSNLDGSDSNGGSGTLLQLLLSKPMRLQKDFTEHPGFMPGVLASLRTSGYDCKILDANGDTIVHSICRAICAPPLPQQSHLSDAHYRAWLSWLSRLLGELMKKVDPDIIHHMLSIHSGIEEQTPLHILSSWIAPHDTKTEQYTAVESAWSLLVTHGACVWSVDRVEQRSSLSYLIHRSRVQTLVEWLSTRDIQQLKELDLHTPYLRRSTSDEPPNLLCHFSLIDDARRALQRRTPSCTPARIIYETLQAIAEWQRAAKDIDESDAKRSLSSDMDQLRLNSSPSETLDILEYLSTLRSSLSMQLYSHRLLHPWRLTSFNEVSFDNPILWLDEMPVYNTPSYSIVWHVLHDLLPNHPEWSHSACGERIEELFRGLPKEVVCLEGDANLVRTIFHPSAVTADGVAASNAGLAIVAWLPSSPKDLGARLLDVLLGMEAQHNFSRQFDLDQIMDQLLDGDGSEAQFYTTTRLLYRHGHLSLTCPPGSTVLHHLVFIGSLVRLRHWLETVSHTSDVLSAMRVCKRMIVEPVQTPRFSPHHIPLLIEDLTPAHNRFSSTCLASLTDHLIKDLAQIAFSYLDSDDGADPSTSEKTP